MNPDRWQQLDELFHAALGIHYSVDRKSTRLNSSHDQISYAVFCLKKKRTRLNSSHDQTSYAVFCLKKKKTRVIPKHTVLPKLPLRLATRLGGSAASCDPTSTSLR